MGSRCPIGVGVGFKPADSPWKSLWNPNVQRLASRVRMALSQQGFVTFSGTWSVALAPAHTSGIWMESNGILMGYITKQLLGNQTWLLGTELGCQGCWMLLDAGGVNKVDVAGKSTMASSGISKPRLMIGLSVWHWEHVKPHFFWKILVIVMYIDRMWFSMPWITLGGNWKWRWGWWMPLFTWQHAIICAARSSVSTREVVQKAAGKRRWIESFFET